MVEEAHRGLCSWCSLGEERKQAGRRCGITHPKLKAEAEPGSPGAVTAAPQGTLDHIRLPLFSLKRSPLSEISFLACFLGLPS